VGLSRILRNVEKLIWPASGQHGNMCHALLGRRKRSYRNPAF